MAKITRLNDNVVAFGSTATGVERTVFGDELTQSDTLDANITADYKRGWGVLAAGAKPPKQFFNGLTFSLSQFIAYLHQVGVAEWNTSQEYHIGSFANVGGVLYSSITDTNIGNDPISTTGFWEGLGSDKVSIASTLADLQAITGSSLIQAVQLMGRTTEGDGGGGVFRWLAGDQSANQAVQLDTQEGLFVKPTSPGDGSTGVWARLDVDTVLVGWFGAIPDNIALAVPNYAAIRAALAMCLYQPVAGAPGLEGQRTLAFGVGEYFVTGNSPLAFTRTELEAMPGNYRYRRGLTYEGHGRSSSILTLVSDDTSPIWIYSNYDAAYPAGMSAMDNLTFRGITFRGVTSGGDKISYEQVNNSKTNGFYWESYGWEKFVQFYDCNFEYLDTTFNISGFGNADHNRWFGCSFSSIRDVVFSIDNNQSVATTFTGCDMELIHGDCFRIGPTGGGDITWTSGSVVLLPELDSLGVPLVTQADKAFISWDNSGVTTGATSSYGNGMFRFTGLRFEIYDASQAIVRTVRTNSTIYGSLQTTFTDCEMANLTDYTGGAPVVDYPLLVLGNKTLAVLTRCTLRHYATYEITKFDSKLIFNDCRYASEAPMAAPFDLLSGKCSVTSAEGSIICRGLLAQLETVVGNYSTTTSSDFNIGYNFFNASKVVSQVKHQLREWPQLGFTGNLKIYLPEGSLITSLLIYKPAESLTAPVANFGYSIKDSAAANLLPFIGGIEDREITMQVSLAAPHKVPAYPNNFITVNAGGTTGSQLFLDKSGYVVIEYL